MSTTIDFENAKEIRTPFEIHCGLSARDTNIDLTFVESGDIETIDSNISTSLDSEFWNMRTLADLSGDGFLLDGSVEWLDTSIAGSLNDGKIGIRAEIGGTFTLTVNSATNIPAVTMAFTSGSGTITVGANTYAIRRVNIIPVNATSITMTITATGTERLCLASVTPGISIEFDNDSLVSCVLALRSNLKIDTPSWEVSDIEIQAHYPYDISEAVSNINDDVPIWYYAGYDGDFSPVRNFYLSEAAEMTNNVLTLKGQDASHKLDFNTITAHYSESTQKASRTKLYNEFKSMITGSGIKLVNAEAAPGNVGASNTATGIVYRETSAREHVANIMNLMRISGFHPTFVDAGIPTVRWTPEVSKWDIYENDCGDVTRVVDRNVAKFTSDEEEYGVINTVTKSNTWLTITDEKKVTAGQRVTFNYDQWYWSYSVTNQRKRIWTTINSIQLIADKTSTSKKVKQTTTKLVKGKKKKVTKTVTKHYNWVVVKGKPLALTKGDVSIQESTKRPGTTIAVKPLVVGKMYSGGAYIFPNFEYLFSRSNISGSFKFKGDPRMQPRDVFTFHRLDGTTEICTIEEITLTHEGGGTSAELKYRKGVC